jgi:hypothetical protein
VAEIKAMEEYIQKALQQGFVCSYTSPALSGFLIITKKDGGLCPCIDYKGLNFITTKYRYRLPLVLVAIEQFCRALFLTKLDLRRAYNLIHI